MHGVLAGPSSAVAQRSSNSDHIPHRGYCESIGLHIPRRWYHRDSINNAAAAVIPPHVLLADLGIESDWSTTSSENGLDDSALGRDQGVRRPSTHYEASLDGVNPAFSPDRKKELQQQQRIERAKRQREVSLS